MKKYSILLILIAVVTLFAELPYNKVFRGVPYDVGQCLTEQTTGSTEGDFKVTIKYLFRKTKRGNQNEANSEKL